MILKNKYTFWFLTLLLCLYSCGDDAVVEGYVSSDASSPRVEVVLNTSNVASNNSEIYVFNGQEPKLDYYHHKVLNIERTPEYLKMKMPEGQWNAVIVGCNEVNIHSLLNMPEFVGTKSQMPMWVTQPANNLLPEVPQIRTALVDGLIIKEDRVENASATLDRNVAKVRVVLKDGVGFKVGGQHNFLLKKVPTSLSWDGSLHPNKNNPTISSLPMSKSVRLFAAEQAGHQKSDTIDFIIPAHKSKSATDTTTHKIVLGMKLTTIGSTVFEKDVIINTVPKDNKVLLVNLTAKGGVEVAIEVADWKTVSSTESLEMYKMILKSNDSKVAKYAMSMLQERNWWVTLDDTDNFEFTNTSTTFGQKTNSPVNIEVKRKTSGQTLSTSLNLHVDGLNGLVEKFSIKDLTL